MRPAYGTTTLSICVSSFCASVCRRSIPFKYNLIRSMQARAWQDVVKLPMIDRVKDRDLVRNQAFINGEFVSGPASGVVNVIDPGNGVMLGTVPDMSEEATLLAIGAAKAALVSWRAVPARERGMALRRWYDLIVQNADDLAMIMTSECGKPFAEVMSTIQSNATAVNTVLRAGVADPLARPRPSPYRPRRRWPTPRPLSSSSRRRPSASRAASSPARPRPSELWSPHPRPANPPHCAPHWGGRGLSPQTLGARLRAGSERSRARLRRALCGDWPAGGDRVIRRGRVRAAVACVRAC